METIMACVFMIPGVAVFASAVIHDRFTVGCWRPNYILAAGVFALFVVPTNYLALALILN